VLFGYVQMKAWYCHIIAYFYSLYGFLIYLNLAVYVWLLEISMFRVINCTE